VVHGNKSAIRPGILTCDLGPQIKSLDSHYLKYKYSLDKCGMNPDINVLVVISKTPKYKAYGAIQSPARNYEYVICELDDCNMKLERIDKNKNKSNPFLLANKINAEWVIISNDRYEIQKIGCHIGHY
jgi:hypothetical protein